jgi:hypothetical protein
MRRLDIAPSSIDFRFLGPCRLLLGNPLFVFINPLIPLHHELHENFAQKFIFTDYDNPFDDPQQKIVFNRYGCLHHEISPKLAALSSPNLFLHTFRYCYINWNKWLFKCSSRTKIVSCEKSIDFVLLIVKPRKCIFQEINVLGFYAGESSRPFCWL